MNCGQGLSGYAGTTMIAGLLLIARDAAGQDQRHVTLTVRWSAESLVTLTGPAAERGSWQEALDATVELEVPAAVLPGGPFAGRPGPRMIGLLPGGAAMPTSLRLSSATLTARYAGRLTVNDKGSCDRTAAYQPGDVVSQGGASPGLAALAVYFSQDSLVGLLVSARPFTVRTTTTTACGIAPSEDERTVTAAFGAPLLGKEDLGAWTTSITRTPAGYTGTARVEVAEALETPGEVRVTRRITFTVEMAGARLAPPAP